MNQIWEYIRHFFLESRQRTLEISVSHHSPSDVAMSRNLPAATLLNQKGFNLSSVEREYSKMIASQTSNVTTKQLECMASSEKSSQLESLSLYSVFFFCGLLLDRMESSTFRSPRWSEKKTAWVSATAKCPPKWASAKAVRLLQAV